MNIIQTFSAHVTDDEWQFAEIQWISHFRSMGFKLTNLDAGGKGGRRSPETLVKMSSAHKGRKRLPFTEEHKANISAALTGKKLSPAHCLKISEAQRGKKRVFSAAHRLALSVAQTGKKHSAETLAKVASTSRGRIKTEQTRAKLSASTTRWWIRKRKQNE